MINQAQFKQILSELNGKATLVAVSKTKPVEDIRELYDLGQRDFGENYVQELLEKQPQLPADIRWHFIGHLQSNKVKYIAPFVHLIHGVDSYKLLNEINTQASKNNRTIDCLLQVHISGEETKFGFDEEELSLFTETVAKYQQLSVLNHVRICGLMGMASFSDNEALIRREFAILKTLFSKYAQSSIPSIQFSILSMGMSSDYKIALEEGSTMVRIGSLLFGQRNYNAS